VREETPAELLRLVRERVPIAVGALVEVERVKDLLEDVGAERLLERIDKCVREAQGLVRTRSVPGVRFVPPQTVFLPQAVPVLNRRVTWTVVPRVF
jgi:hypothetical protein